VSWTDNPTNNNSYCACDFAEFRCSIIAAIPSCSGYVINHHFKTSNDRRIIQPHSSLLSHPKTKAAVARIFVRGLDFPYPSLPFPTSSLALHLPFPLLTSFPLSPHLPNPFPPSFLTPPNPLRGLEQRCKIHQLGPGEVSC